MSKLLQKSKSLTASVLELRDEIAERLADLTLTGDVEETKEEQATLKSIMNYLNEEELPWRRIRLLISQYKELEAGTAVDAEVV